MTELDEALQRWRAVNPARTVLNGDHHYKRCRTPTCPVDIEITQERVFCYGCGGKPNVGLEVRQESVRIEAWRREFRKSVYNRREYLKRKALKGNPQSVPDFSTGIG